MSSDPRTASLDPGRAGVMSAADQAFALPSSRRGFLAATATKRYLEAEAGFRLWRTTRTSGALAGYAQSEWDSLWDPEWGIRAEVRF